MQLKPNPFHANPEQRMVPDPAYPEWRGTALLLIRTLVLVLILDLEIPVVTLMFY